MATKVYVIACVVILYSATTNANDDVVANLVKYIERMDAKLDNVKESARLREELLLRKIEELDQRVNTLEEESNQGMNSRIHRQFKNNDFEQSVEYVAAAERSLYKSQQETTASKIRPDNVKLGDLGIEKPKRALQSEYNVAFSAYMDHVSNGIGVGQTLISNQILLNDGNAYNHHTGIFTVPIAGVYSFTFFVDKNTRDSNQEYAQLIVNSENKVDAVVQTDGGAEDAQGGNSAVLKVNVGDAVFVRSVIGSHVEGSSSVRITTFSGFLLYPAEDGSVGIVGK